MKERLKSFFTTNIVWKILAVVLAIIVWVIIMNFQDPTTQKTVNVKIEYINHDLLRDNDQKVFLSGPETVPILVTMRTSQIDAVTASDFSCKADLTMRSGGDIANQSVRIDVEQVDGQGTILSWEYQRNDPYVTVSLDEYVSKEFPVEMIWNDDVEELKPEEVTFSPQTIVVSGPSSKFTNVARAVVPMTLSDLTQGEGGEFNCSVDVKLYDLNGEEISGTEVFDFDHKQVKMTAKIANLKKISLIYQDTVSGIPVDSHFVSNVETPISSVTVMSLSHIDMSELQIPLSVIDITGISEDKIYNIDLVKYLPQGVYLSDSERWITVKVVLTAYEKKTFSFTSNNVQFEGENPEYQYILKNMPFVTVSGKAEVINALTQESFQPTVVVTNLEPGIHSTRIAFQTPADVTMLEQSSTAEVEIVTIEASSEAESETAESSSETSQGGTP